MADAALTIDFNQFNLALLQLTNPAFLRELVHAGALTIESKFKRYPPANRLSREQVYGTTFQSDKQRRFFFWALRNGVIQVPYFRGQNPRSENLQQSWNVVMLDNLTAQIGTAVSYAPLVMDAERQTMYAKAVGWRSVQSILPDAEPEARAAMETELQKASSAWG